MNRENLFERERVSRAVLKLSAPTVASNLVMVVYSLADTFFVGLMNDPIQTAAVALASPVLLAFNAVNNLFGVGSSSMMSRALGRKDMDTLKKSSAFGFYGALLSALCFSLLCFVLQEPLLKALGATQATIEPTRSYLMWTVFFGATPAILNVVMAYLIRSEGATLHASIGTMSGCLLNIVLDPIFILIFRMGAQGAALATMLSNMFALMYFFGYLLIQKNKTVVCISIRQLSFRKDIVMGICAVGIPASIQNLLNVVSQMVLNNLAALYGTAAVAAMGIAAKVSLIPCQIAMGISQGVMPLIGYAFAAKNVERMKGVLRFTMLVAMSLLVVMTIGYELFPNTIISAFIDNAETIEYGTIFLRPLALSQPFLVLDFIGVGVFQAIGNGKISLFMALARKALFEIPLMFVLNSVFGFYGLGFCQLGAEACMAMIAMICLMRFLHRFEQEQVLSFE